MESPQSSEVAFKAGVYAPAEETIAGTIVGEPEGESAPPVDKGANGVPGPAACVVSVELHSSGLGLDAGAEGVE
jgi:hypothetical protein